LGSPARGGAAPFVSTGPDAFGWLEQDALGPVVLGARFGTRSTFVSDVALVTLRDAENGQRPAHLVPDHAPTGDVSYDSAHGVLQFAQLADAAGRPCVWVTDAKYGNFSATIAFSSTVPPTLKLGQTDLLEANADQALSTCRLPPLDTSAGGSLRLVRSSTRLNIELGTQSVSCDVPSERLPLGVCGSQLGAVALTRLEVTRTN